MKNTGYNEKKINKTGKIKNSFTSPPPKFLFPLKVLIKYYTTHAGNIDEIFKIYPGKLNPK